MNSDEISAFLTVVDAGSISAAAAILYTTQGAVSKKIANLEKELGIHLLIRGKGIHGVTLTSDGTQFLNMAREMDTLFKDTETLKEKKGQSYLSIGALASFTELIFNDFLHGFIRRHPNITLSVHSYHSSEAYMKLSDHFIDLGYVAIRKDIPNIRCTTLVHSPLVVITKNRTDMHPHMSVQELDPSHEIYIRKDAKFDAWHEQNFVGKQYLMRVGSDFTLKTFLDLEGSWAFTSEPIALALSKQYGFRFYSLDGVDQSSEMFEIEHSYTRPSRVAVKEIFRKELKEYLAGSPNSSLTL